VTAFLFPASVKNGRNFYYCKTAPNDNRKITNYYIVPVERNLSLENSKNVLGPLTLDQFNKKKADLSIPETLKFTVVYENLQ
jgi:hypothetical protein